MVSNAFRHIESRNSLVSYVSAANFQATLQVCKSLGEACFVLFFKIFLVFVF